MIRSKALDLAFVEEILAEPGGEQLLTCWSCGTCAATCLVRRFEPSFNPRLLLHKAGLGMREEVLSSREIWQCSACDACYPRCPRQIHISDVMGAIRNIAIREGYQAPGPSAVSDSEVCSGCGLCSRACPYGASSLVAAADGAQRLVAQVDPNLCQGCGVCVAVCPTGAMQLERMSDQELLTRMGAEGWLDQPRYLDGGAPEPRLLVFVCQWSLRSDADLARLNPFEERVRVVNLPCSGRVDPAMVLMALNAGADGVLVVGCKAGECHYQRGTYLGRGKVALLGDMLNTLNVAPARLRFAESGALDRFAVVRWVTDMSNEIASLPVVTSKAAAREDGV